MFAVKSDVDVGVVCFDTFFEVYPEGTTRETFGNVAATYTYPQYKNELGEALSGLTSTSTRTVIVSAPANDNQASSTPPAANENHPLEELSATGTDATSTAQ